MVHGMERLNLDADGLMWIQMDEKKPLTIGSGLLGGL